MELKDVILSTLAEMEEEKPLENVEESVVIEDVVTKTVEPIEENRGETSEMTIESELLYLNSIRERLLVLFEGFQAPNNANIEAKIDMTLNFLEYTLATIDERVEKLERGNS
ncbi:FIG00469478: hypothetical protein [hydrothermal vent metagenome]|uniref:Campylobacter invasion antigen D C-terminal domain-containing protein n=1 Tax=hydrothermal vent metagenome TaxID=652676 RepID=A0A1W1CX54_9ZZZZ